MAGEGKSEEFNVIVNARPEKIADAEMSYDEAVRLAFGDNPPTGENIVITVSWRHGNDGGTLVEGQSVKTQNGMKFDVTPTNKS